MENFGLIISEPKETDYMFGGIAGQILQPSGQWHDYLPMGEKQHSVYFDTMACVTFSALNALEILIRRQYGIDINFSDRFTAKMSGTTHQGNHLYKVGDSIRKDGFVDEVEYPYPREQRTPVFTWEDFYQEIPQILKDLGIENLKDCLIQYEQMGKDYFKEALKEAPIQVTVRAWYDANGDLVYENSDPTKVNHAVVLIGYKDGEYWEIYDSYDKNGSYVKKLEWNYAFGQTGFKYNIKKINMSNTLKFKDKNSSTAGFFLPALTEDAYKSLAKNFGLEVKLKADGSVDWANEKLDGTYQLN